MCRIDLSQLLQDTEKDSERGLMKTDTINGPLIARQQGVSNDMCYVLLICLAKREICDDGCVVSCRMAV